MASKSKFRAKSPEAIHKDPIQIDFKKYIDDAMALSEGAVFLDEDNCYDLASGHAGYSLMFTHLGRLLRAYGASESDIAVVTQRSEHHLLAAASSWKKASYKSFGLYDGASGYLFALTAYDRYTNNQTARSERLAVSLSEQVIQYLQGDSVTASYIQSFYDVISGISGALSVCQYVVPTENVDVIIRLLKLLSVNPEKPEQSYIYIHDNFPSQHLQQYYPNGYIDFGVAHGITGVIPRLIYSSGDPLACINKWNELGSIMEWVVKSALLKAQSGVWTCGKQEVLLQSLEQMRLRWCYGQMSSMLNIYNLAKSCLSDTTLKSLEAYLDSVLVSDTIRDALIAIQQSHNYGLCHGLSGALLTIEDALLQNERISNEERNKIQQIIILMAETLSLDTPYYDLHDSDCVHSGFLNGAVGALLTKWALRHPDVPKNKQELQFLLFGG